MIITKKPDESKTLEELASEIRDLKDKNTIYGCILCLSLVGGSALTYAGSAAAIVAIIIFIVGVIPSMICWVLTLRRIKKLQKLGLARISGHPQSTTEPTFRSITNKIIYESLISEDNRQRGIQENHPRLIDFRKAIKSNSNGFETQSFYICEVCNQPIKDSKEKFECPECGYKAHKVHFLIWFQKQNSCPKCKINYD